VPEGRQLHPRQRGSHFASVAAVGEVRVACLKVCLACLAGAPVVVLDVGKNGPACPRLDGVAEAALALDRAFDLVTRFLTAAEAA
jgi:hypothetical protein